MGKDESGCSMTIAIALILVAGTAVYVFYKDADGGALAGVLRDVKGTFGWSGTNGTAGGTLENAKTVWLNWGGKGSDNGTAGGILEYAQTGARKMLEWAAKVESAVQEKWGDEKSP